MYSGHGVGLVDQVELVELVGLGGDGLGAGE